MTTALACHFHSMIYVPLYDTLGEPAIVHIIKQSEFRNGPFDLHGSIRCFCFVQHR
jgi:hypothetical protein